MPNYHIKTISLHTFKEALSRYASTVPDRLQELDTLRYDTIPERVADRGTSTGLQKDELVQLVDWKLKHGTFRPKLLSLVQSNAEKDVEKVTKQAAELIAQQKDVADLSALKCLVALSGVGPATASLLLSVMHPQSCPFFSDEMFRWAVWDETGSPDGWERKIKYNNAEYAVVVRKVEELRLRLGKDDVSALDAERVAWVLGKEGVEIVDAGAAECEPEESAKGGTTEKKVKDVSSKQRQKQKQKQELGDEAHAEAARTEKKKTMKRKAADAKIPAESVRKSTRVKK